MTKNLKLPNFLIIGAMKSGTTTLYETLNNHPQVYMSRLKEPNFFAYDGTQNFPITNLHDYQALFQNVSSEKAIGEASTLYLFKPKAAESIHKYIPQVKLITILRDPADRAYSLYLMRYRGNEFEESISNDKILDHLAQYVRRGRGGVLSQRYYESLNHYFNLFEKKQLKIYFYQDLKQDHQSLFQDICDFIDVDKKLLTEQLPKKANKGGLPKSKTVHSSLEKLRKTFNKTLLPVLPDKILEPMKSAYTEIKNINLVKAPPLPPEIRQQLIAIYREDILRIQELMQRDLSDWLQVK